MQKHCPPENCRFTIRQIATRCSLSFAIRYSPFTIRCLFTSRQSLFAIRCRFFPTCRFADLTICRKLGSAGASPSRLIPSCVPLSDKLDGS
jgi:hypothetical protein